MLLTARYLYNVLMDVGEVLYISAVMVWAVMTLAYFVSLFIKNVGFVDLVWGLGFMMLALIVQQALGADLTYTFMIVFTLVMVWGARLSIHLASRFDPKKEDWRYAAMRKKSNRHFIWKSYFSVFMTQGIFMMLIATPLMVAAIIDDVNTWQVVLGSGIWAVGFIVETVGDMQLAKFRKNRTKKDQFITSGLWKYSRHPNYFGEVTMWWGLFVIVATTDYYWLALISPLVITYLILAVSGVPLMESKWKTNKKYQAYAKKTSVLVPWPPKA